MEKSPVQWSDLPPELCSLIGQRLKIDIDVLRFRCVCRSWRASLPPLNAISIPFPHFRDYGGAGSIVLHQTIISCISSPLHRRPHRHRAPTSKIQICSLDPFSNHIVINNRNLSLSNSLDSQIYEVARSYTLRHNYGCFPRRVDGIRKVIMCPNSVWTDLGTCTIVAVYGRGSLGFVRHGDEKWTPIHPAKFDFQDVIVYNGQIYAIDSRGTLFWIDSDPDSNSWMELVKFSAAGCCSSSHRKHLVACGGELYSVHRFPYTVRDCYPKNKFEYTKEKIFQVYRLEEHDGRMMWVRVMNLKDHAFVLGEDCCFSTEEFRANCIYFNHGRRQDCKTLTSSVFNFKQGWVSI